MPNSDQEPETKRTKRPTFTSPREALKHYTNQYYKALQKDPKIKIDNNRKLELIYQLNDQYIADLKKKNWHTEESSQQFLKDMDLLTNAITKKRKEDERKNEAAALKQRLFGLPET